MNTVKNKYRGTTNCLHVLAALVRAAQYRGVTTYQDIAVIMGLPMKGSHMGAELGWVLGEIAEDEVRASRPMLSAVAVGVSGKPGPGFFDLDRELGKLGKAESDQEFWRNERDAAYEAWKRPLAAATDGRARHIRDKGFDNQYYRDLIVQIIREHQPVPREEIDTLLLDKLPEILSPEQKRRKIHNLLMTLSGKEHRIRNAGSRRYSQWVLVADSETPASTKNKEEQSP